MRCTTVPRRGGVRGAEQVHPERTFNRYLAVPGLQPEVPRFETRITNMSWQARMCLGILQGVRRHQSALTRVARLHRVFHDFVKELEEPRLPLFVQGSAQLDNHLFQGGWCAQVLNL
jgi:hypothetical protein